MAHFAELDNNNVVLRVVVIANEDTADINGVEQENIGVAFCENLYGGIWKQTSYNSNFRKHYASIGDIYDPQRDAFIAPQPFISWVLNENTCIWEPPIPYPMDGKSYIWDEPSLSWVLLNAPT
jgi:hypothetical protein